MNNPIKFKYNGKLYNPKDPEKKLKQLGITWNDVELIQNSTKQQEQIEYADPNRLFYFINRKTGYSYSSIYPTFDREDYEPITYDELKRLWKKD